MHNIHKRWELTKYRLSILCYFTKTLITDNEIYTLVVQKSQINKSSVVRRIFVFVLYIQISYSL